MAEEVVVAPVVDLSAELAKVRQELQEREDRLAVVEVEKDNYKTVALKRKGKLDSDDNFFGEHDENDVEKIVSQKVASTQRERENARQLEEAQNARKIADEKLAEVLRAKDNTPASPVGGSSGGGQEVKDAVFSEAQIAGLHNKWSRMGFTEDAQKRMLETEKKNALARRPL